MKILRTPMQCLTCHHRWCAVLASAVAAEEFACTAADFHREHVRPAPGAGGPGLYLASSYAGTGGFTGAIMAGAAAAEAGLADRLITAST